MVARLVDVLCERGDGCDRLSQRRHEVVVVLDDGVKLLVVGRELLVDSGCQVPVCRLFGSVTEGDNKVVECLRAPFEVAGQRRECGGNSPTHQLLEDVRTCQARPHREHGVELLPRECVGLPRRCQQIGLHRPKRREQFGDLVVALALGQFDIESPDAMWSAPAAIAVTGSTKSSRVMNTVLANATVAPASNTPVTTNRTVPVAQARPASATEAPNCRPTAASGSERPTERQKRQRSTYHRFVRSDGVCEHTHLFLTCVIRFESNSRILKRISGFERNRLLSADSDGQCVSDGISTGPIDQPLQRAGRPSAALTLTNRSISRTTGAG